jgi:hypothetical protein
MYPRVSICVRKQVQGKWALGSNAKESKYESRKRHGTEPGGFSSETKRELGVLERREKSCCVNRIATGILHSSSFKSRDRCDLLVPTNP